MGLAIVAIPAEDDYVWRISSEKVPHCTLLFLGETDDKPVDRISAFLGHAVRSADFSPFGLSVDHRGLLGEDKADVLFFKRDRYSFKRLEEFRGQLLKNNDIRDAYDSAVQFPEWTPHLTLGYPESPAKKDTRDYPGIQWVQFDRIALWTGNYQGPWFRLEYNDDLAEVAMNATAEAGKEFLEHFGVKGMKWGVRKAKTETVTVGGKTKQVTPKKAAKLDKKWEKNQFTLPKGIERHNAMAAHFNERIGALNDKFEKDDFSKESYDTPAKWSPRFKEYNKQLYALEEKSFNHAVKEVHGSSPTGKKRMETEQTADGLAMVVRDVKVEHAATIEEGDEVFLFRVTRNASGLITKIEPENTLEQSIELGSEFIAHYGVKGMRWGVRKERVSDVSTEAVINRGLRNKTKVKAKGGQGQAATEDAIKAAGQKQKLKKSGVAALSNKELEELRTRLQLEQQVTQLAAPKGKRFVQKKLGQAGEQQLNRGIQEGIKEATSRASKK